MVATRRGEPSTPVAPLEAGRLAGAGARTRSPAFSGEAIFLGVVIVLHLVLLTVVFPALREDVVLRGNLELFFHDSGRTLDGAMPYRDFLLEYPPGSLIFMLIPHLFATGYLGYRLLFFWQVALFDAVIVLSLAAIARTASLSLARVLVLYTQALILLGPLVLYRIDIAPAALTVLAVLFWLRNRPSLAAAALAAGAATKLYPLVLIVPLIMDQWAQGRARRAPLAVLAFAITLLVFVSPALLAGPALIQDVRFQTNRHLQIESVWAIVPLWLHVFAQFPMEVLGRGRALVIIGPGDAFGQAGLPVMALIILAIYWRWWVHVRALVHWHGERAVQAVKPTQLHKQRMRLVLTGTTALVLAMAILSKVLSPQYLIWLLPLIVLLPLRSRWTALAVTLFVLSLPLTHWVYPLHYGELIRLLETPIIAVLTMRNVLLILALIALLRAFWISPLPSNG